ncbi:biotin/lipoyl-containing protein [Williamsia soli]|uniref:biotin/lipoyl-containing protein n=1 Tax=Williamsia soli TaxID=364929 RepID=UPI001A9E07BC|nr:biotin/lipoyl-containing protein [Williamsia soli]
MTHVMPMCARGTIGEIMADIIEVKIPHSGSVENVEINEWLVAVGDDVEADQAIADVSTDKVDTELVAPCDGRIAALLFGDESELSVGTVAALMVAPGVSDEDAAAAVADYTPSSDG